MNLMTLNYIAFITVYIYKVTHHNFEVIVDVSRLTITIPTDLGYITVAKVKEDVK